ncbi:hypothetical protein GCM10009753_34720 [Streptantibioticus ferralitis]
MRCDIAPLTGVGRNPESQSAAEAAAGTVQRDHDNAVVRVKAQKEGQGLGQIGGTAESDARLTGRAG